MLCTSPSPRRVGATFSTSDKVAITCPAQLSCSASQVSVWCCTFLSIHGAFTHSGTVDYPLFMVFTLLPYPLCCLSSPSRWYFFPLILNSYAKKVGCFIPPLLCFVSYPSENYQSISLEHCAGNHILLSLLTLKGKVG